jgi:uncharacterized protein
VNLVDKRTGVEVIERRECLALLAAEEVGRLGIIDGGAPLVLPVNFALDGEAIVIRTAPGSKLSAARGRSACFEVDGFDRGGRSGWSVVVRGRMAEVTTLDRPVYDRVRDLASPWLPGERDHVVRLVPGSITGRRVPPVDTRPPPAAS